MPGRTLNDLAATINRSKPLCSSTTKIIGIDGCGGSGKTTMAEWHDAPVGGIVLVEGVSALQREFRDAYSYGFFVNAPRALCLERSLARNGTDALAQWQAWMGSEDAYIADHKPQEFADEIVNGARSDMYKPKVMQVQFCKSSAFSTKIAQISGYRKRCLLPWSGSPIEVKSTYSGGTSCEF